MSRRSHLSKATRPKTTTTAPRGKHHRGHPLSARARAKTSTRRRAAPVVHHATTARHTAPRTHLAAAKTHTAGKAVKTTTTVKRVVAPAARTQPRHNTRFRTQFAALHHPHRYLTRLNRHHKGFQTRTNTRRHRHNRVVRRR